LRQLGLQDVGNSRWIHFRKFVWQRNSAIPMRALSGDVSRVGWMSNESPGLCDEFLHERFVVGRRFCHGTRWIEYPRKR
jgi:hypothetical protein